MEEALSGVNVGAIVAFMIVAAFLALLIWVITSERRRVQVEADQVQRMGFTPLEPPPPDLITRVGALRLSRPDQGFELRRVFHRPISGGDLYIFDLEIKGGEDSADEHGSVAVLAQGLDLPRLMLLPKPSVQGAVGGWMSQLAERLIGWAAERSGLVAFDLPELHQHYIVMGQDEVAVRRFLTRERITRLVTMERRYVINGKGDIFVLSRSVEQRAQPARMETLYPMREDAEQLLAWFRSGSMTYL